VPRFVDHDLRREFVTEVAAELIAERGVEELTVRKVATAAGFSTTVVSHYFLDKRDLLRSTFRAAARRSSQRFEAAAKAENRTLASCLESLLPVDAETRRDWKLFIAFWAMATGDAELDAEHRRRLRSARSRFHRVLLEDPAEFGSDVDLRALASALMTTVHGIAMQAIFDPEYWTPRRQAEELRFALDLRVAASSQG
jgi:TetR/AcrR family transcriptional repressor of bet genes